LTVTPARKTCQRDCQEIQTHEPEPDEDVRLLLLAYPSDLRVLSSDLSLIHAFERHYRGVVRKSDEHVLQTIYALPSAVVLLPEVVWQKSLALIADQDKGGLDKLRKSWERDGASIDIQKERMHIISRMNNSKIEKKV
jgi:hypothetical protein